MADHKTGETRVRRAEREARTADLHHVRAKAKYQAAHDLGRPVEGTTIDQLDDARARKLVADQELSQAKKEAAEEDKRR